MSAVLIHPKSRGCVRLNSNDTQAAPAIFANYLAKPGDLETLVRGVQVGRQITLCHPEGTCKKGSDPLAVVDSQLRVHGLEALRVVDA